MFNAISFTGISKFQGYKKTNPAQIQQLKTNKTLVGDSVYFASKSKQIEELGGEVGYRKNNVGIVAEKYADEIGEVVKILNNPNLTLAEKDALERYLLVLATGVEQLKKEI